MSFILPGRQGGVAPASAAWSDGTLSVVEKFNGNANPNEHQFSLSSSVAAGDLAIYAKLSDDTTTVPTPSPPTGWTAVGYNLSLASRDVHFDVYYKILVSGDVNSTVTTDNENIDLITGWVIRHSGGPIGGIRIKGMSNGNDMTAGNPAAQTPGVSNGTKPLAAFAFGTGGDESTTTSTGMTLTSNDDSDSDSVSGRAVESMVRFYDGADSLTNPTADTTDQGLFNGLIAFYVEILESAATEEGTATISGEVISNTREDAICWAGLRVNRDGTIDKWTETGAYVQIDSGTDWINANADANHLYEVKLDVTAGSLTWTGNSATATWIPVAEEPEWGHRRSTTGTDDADVTLRIRFNGGSEIDNGTYDITAQRTTAPPVGMGVAVVPSVLILSA